MERRRSRIIPVTSAFTQLERGVAFDRNASVAGVRRLLLRASIERALAFVDHLLPLREALAH